MCPGAYLKYHSVVGPKPLYCKLTDTEVNSYGIHESCPLFDYEEPDGFVEGERKF
jgi:hypothetical protein